MAKVYRFTLSGVNTYNGAEYEFGLHYQTDVPALGSEPSAGTVLTQIRQHFSSSGTNLSKLRAAIPSSHSLLKTWVREEVQPGSGDVPAFAEQAETGFGALASSGTDILPGAMAVWHQMKTGNAIRSGRGGTHVPGSVLPADLSEDGHWAVGTTHWTAHLALAAAFLDKLEDVFGGTGDINPVVYSRTRRARGESFAFELEAVTPLTQVRWLRSRMT